MRTDKKKYLPKIIAAVLCVVFSASMLSSCAILDIIKNKTADIIGEYQEETEEAVFSEPEMISEEASDDESEEIYESSEESEVPEYITMIVYVDNKLNLREGPGTDFDVVTTLERGDEVKVYSEEDGWYFLEYNGIFGWCSAEFVLRPEDIPELPEDIMTPDEVLEILLSGKNFSFTLYDSCESDIGMTGYATGGEYTVCSYYIEGNKVFYEEYGSEFMGSAYYLEKINGVWYEIHRDGSKTKADSYVINCMNSVAAFSDLKKILKESNFGKFDPSINGFSFKPGYTPDNYKGFKLNIGALTFGGGKIYLSIVTEPIYTKENGVTTSTVYYSEYCIYDINETKIIPDVNNYEWDTENYQ